jgi:hypothetical protein
MVICVSWMYDNLCQWMIISESNDCCHGRILAAAMSISVGVFCMGAARRAHTEIV